MAKTRKPRAADVVLAYLGEQRDVISQLEPDVRVDAPDAVHQMRVATRRARSTLQAHRNVLDREFTRALADELKWLAGVLGEARDLEVLGEGIAADVAAQPAELVLGPVQARVVTYFAARHADAHRGVTEALDSQRCRDLLAAFDVLLADPPLLKTAKKPACKPLVATLAKQRRRVRRHLAAAKGEQRDVELHEARKAAKRLRYVAEAAEPVLGKRAADVVGACKEFQDLLGEHQDAIVAVPYLRDLARVAHFSGENGFTFGVILGHRLATPVGDPAAVRESWKGLAKQVDRLVY